MAIDVKHIYAWVKENNPREYLSQRFNKEHQPTGDPDCRLGVKLGHNQEHADGSSTAQKECLWGYGSGIISATTPDYGDVVLADIPKPLNVLMLATMICSFNACSSLYRNLLPIWQPMRPLMPGMSTKITPRGEGWLPSL